MKKEDIVYIIEKKCCEVVPELAGHKFELTDILADLGANSLDRSDIIALTLEELNLKIPLVQLARAKSIGQLAEVLSTKVN